MDKRITRLANSGVKEVTMFGKTWKLSPGTYRIDMGPKVVVKQPRIMWVDGPMGPTPQLTKPKMGYDPKNAKIVRVDGDTYLNPALSGGMCVKLSDYTRFIR